MTFAEAAIQWWAQSCSRWNSKHAKQVNLFISLWMDRFNGQEVDSVSTADVQAYEAYRDNGQRSGSALNAERTYLRMFYKWALQRYLVSKDRTQGWRHRSTRVVREYVELTREQEEKLIRQAPFWLQVFVHIAVATGLREGTIRQLTWGMVQGEALVIPAEIMKGRESLRLPIVGKLKKALCLLGPREPRQKILKHVPSATSVWRAFKRAAQKAGLPAAASPHDLRRTFVSRLTEAGTPLQTIMALGAWKTPGVLLKHYASKLNPEAARKALEAI